MNHIEPREFDDDSWFRAQEPYSLADVRSDKQWIRQARNPAHQHDELHESHAGAIITH